jgi:uncharacterized protein
MEEQRSLPVLSPEEVRVLGALIEKSRTTPEYYPMTLNALTAACNQKTSRNPVVEYDEETVMSALNNLKSHSLVATAIGGGSRAAKYKHNFGTVYDVTDGQLALMCLLFLRSAQTPGELNTNSGRLYEFSGLESVQQALLALTQLKPPFVKELPKRSGQKEARFIHLFGGEIRDWDENAPQESTRKNVSTLEARVAALEQEIEKLKEVLSRNSIQ